MPVHGSGGILSVAARARRPRSAGAVCLRDSNTSEPLPGCLAGNKSWRKTRTSTRLADAGPVPSAGTPLRFESLSVCMQCRPAQRKTADLWEPSASRPRTPVSLRSIFPCARGPALRENQVLVIDRPCLGQAWRPHPSALHQRPFVPQSSGLAQRNDSGGTPRNPGSIPRLEIGSYGLFGDNQQHPIAVRPPLLFKIRALDPEKFATRRIVDENGLALPIDACYYHVVERGSGATWLNARDQRPALF